MLISLPKKRLVSKIIHPLYTIMCVCVFRDANPVSVVEWDWDGEDKVMIRPPVNLAFLQGWKTLCKARNFGRFRSYDGCCLLFCMLTYSPTPTLQV